MNQVSEADTKTLVPRLGDAEMPIESPGIPESFWLPEVA